MEPQEAVALFTEQLGVSGAMAQLEVRRYTFDDPAQAGSYYVGWKKVQAMKEKLKRKLGNDFAEPCFNNAVLSMGLLPIAMIDERLSRDLTCKSMGERSASLRHLQKK